MTKEQGKEEETQPTTPEQQPQPTTEAQLEQLQQELKSKDVEYQKTLSRMQGLEGSLKEKDRLIKEQGTIRSEIEGLREYTKTLAAIIAEKESLDTDVDDIPPERKQKLYKTLEVAEQKIAQKRAEEELQRNKDEYNAQANAIWAKAQEAVKDNRDKRMIEMYLKSGDIKGAQEIIDEATKTEDKVNDDMPKTKADLEKLIQERLKQEKIASGALDTETGLPAGSTGVFTQQQVDNMTVEEYRENRAEIQAAIRAGRMK